MGASNVRILNGSVPVSAENPLPFTSVPSTPSASTKATFIRGLTAPGATGTPVALAAAGTYVQSVTIFAMRAGRVANATSVFVDSVAANDLQLIEITPGAWLTFIAPPGKVIDLGELYVDSTTLTDGVLYLGVV